MGLLMPYITTGTFDQSRPLFKSHEIFFFDVLLVSERVNVKFDSLNICKKTSLHFVAASTMDNS